MMPHRPLLFLALFVGACQSNVEPLESASAAIKQPRARTAQALTVLGAEIATPVVAPGASLSYTLRFDGAVPLPRPYRVFVHFLDPNTGNYVFQDDFDPTPGTTEWRGSIRETRTVTVPTGVSGKLPISVGLYIPVEPYEGFVGAIPGAGVEQRNGAFIVGSIEVARVAPFAGGVDIEGVINDMLLPASAYARPNSQAAVIFSGNYAQALKLSPRYAPSFNNITSWCWAFATAEHRAQNTAVEVRYSDVYALRRSTNAWVLIDSGRPSGFRGDLRGAQEEYKDEVIVDEDTVRVRPGAPPRTDLVSYELWTPNAAKQIDFVPDLKAVYASCQMRFVTLDPAAPDDSGAARYAGQIGFDFWRRGAGPFEPGVTQFWGPNGRMKPITKEWQTFSVVSLKPGESGLNGLPAELGFGPAWEVENPFLDPPYTLTVAELRGNPPPLR
jgi:hypothetical protein